MPTAFHLEVGSRETAVIVQHKEDVLQKISQIEGVRRFRADLEQTGHTVHCSEFLGAHDSAAWRQTLPAALRWALA
jgi:enterochelin esterase-like enzyme